MNKIKIFEVSKYCGGEYSRWIANKVLVDSVDQADVVFFKGGDDVDPSLYNESRHYSTQSHLNRDLYEQQVYRTAIKAGKKVIGVCRGLQFLSVMNGCKLFQDITGHAGSHFMQNVGIEGFEPFKITSTHHQALPLREAMKNPEFKLFGVAEAKVTYSHHEYVEDEYYPIVEMGMFGRDTLVIQSHPEMVVSNGKITEGYEHYIEYCRILFNKLIER